jgi:BirA family transcriptional regulator, biotin operon repressor / biotin---[acetyl-CoA-carboxylase] ligase
MQLDPVATAAGLRLHACETLPSTNAEALARARRGEASFWVTARTQTAGRGRRGNAWRSDPGNLFATLLLCDPAPPEHAPELAFVAALAVHDAISARAPALRPKLALKWPNDVLHGGGKLAGILIEAESGGAGEQVGEPAGLVVAIGIGVNCLHHPAQTSYPATDLAAAGASVGAEDLFGTLSGTMQRRLAHWDRGANFSAIRADWLAHAAGVGGELLVRLPGRDLRGRFEALDERGRLLLRLPGGSLETVSAGDVFPFPAPASSAPQEGRVV